MKKYSIKKIFFSIIIGIFAIFFGLAMSIGFVNAQKIIYGLRLASISDIGGMDLDAAKREVENIAIDFQNRKVNLNVKGTEYETTLENLGAYINIDKTLSDALTVGRSGNFLVNLIEQVNAIINGRNIDVVVEFDELKMESFLKGFKKYEINREDASVYFDEAEGNFIISDSIVGNIVDRAKIKNNVYDFINNNNENVLNMEIYFFDEYPEVTDAMAMVALEDTNEFFADYNNLKLIYNDSSSWPVDRKTLGVWVGLKLSGDKKKLEVFWDGKKISEYLTLISQNINQEPVDAVLTYKDNKVDAFSLSRDGKYVNVASSAENILASLNDQEKEARMEFDAVKAKIDILEIENLGLTSLLATGVSDFAGSPANRMHNIKVGTAKFNGILIAPGEEFSFVGHLGDVGAAEGYLPELVIKNNKTIPEYGGGVCQVSTTVFRVAVLAGLEIRERYPHSFPVKYYEPQGFDAAIYPPSPDLKFVNDTSNNILIQSKVKGTKVYFEFYGTDDGRKVVLNGPEEYDKKPDGSMKAKLTREIFDKEGELVRKTIFRSSYKSPNLYPVIRNPLE